MRDLLRQLQGFAALHTWPGYFRKPNQLERSLQEVHCSAMNHKLIGDAPARRTVSQRALAFASVAASAPRKLVKQLLHWKRFKVRICNFTTPMRS